MVKVPVQIESGQPITVVLWFPDLQGKYSICDIDGLGRVGNGTGQVTVGFRLSCLFQFQAQPAQHQRMADELNICGSMRDRDVLTAQLVNIG